MNKNINKVQSRTRMYILRNASVIHIQEDQLAAKGMEHVKELISSG